ncbi:hypothetical protein WJX81_003230 [Elliptochloris bilobata]|uniref:Uncharacterized protein n=1 Tax=Elliptochloris bilobata TaxID=381761 RepID=A0AAW1RIG3_9CHLO
MEVVQCSVCGAEGQHVRVKQVAWAGVEFVDLIDAPILSCPLCNKSFAAHPLPAGCFPGTPVESSDVATERRPSSELLLWVDIARMEEVLESLGNSKAQVEELLQRRAQYEAGQSLVMGWKASYAQLSLAVHKAKSDS